MTRDACARRSLDVAGAGLGLVLLAPVMAVTAAAVRLRMGRPVLFVQDRAGRDGKTFRMIKFRTMTGASDDPADDEVRLRPLGRTLRATSIDELPTLMNVLLGEMSLVGPRPLPVRYLRRYSEREARRLTVRPGMTGWAQVNGRNALTWDERLELDAWYVENQSLLLDLRILARTLGTVVRREGISHLEHATMPELAPPGQR